MDQFVVPQFIDVEDKIIGPITTRQFVIMIAAGLWLVIAYKFFDMALFVLAVLLTAGTVALFGFYKVNGRPFNLFLISIIQVNVKPRLRVWNRSDMELSRLGETREATPKVSAPIKRMSRTRLTELALQVDTGGVYQGEEPIEIQSAKLKMQN